MLNSIFTPLFLISFKLFNIILTNKNNISKNKTTTKRKYKKKRGVKTSLE